MNWIKTDIEIGYRIKCFDIDYYQFRIQFSQTELGDIETLENIFTVLKTRKGKFPKTSEIVRISMPPNKMCIRFWVQDSSSKPMQQGEEIPSENIILKDSE